jgi:regulator of nonsense transcripts 3
VPARAYIAFRAPEQVAEFGREYDGHVFQDKAGSCRTLCLSPVG